MNSSKLWYRIVPFFLFFISILFPCFSQNNGETILIKGTVRSEAGEPLIGVSILVKETQKGISSDINGQFTLKAAKSETLRFSYVGYLTQEVKITDETLNIVLIESTAEIAQVVITGYAKTELRKSTGSVGIVTAKELKDAPLEGVDKLLQGKLAGVNVTRQSGRPGTAAKIRIRGTSTITGNAEPLWVIDGVPLQKDIPKLSSTYIKSGDFSDIFASGIGGINPLDIESINILKDASAAAIYGSRASGGVIVVTTKKGKKGALRLNYSGSVSLQTKPQRSAGLMNSAQKLAYEQSIWDEFSATGYNATLQGKPTHYPVIGIVGMIRSGYGKFAGMSLSEQDQYIEKLGNETTDWFNALFRNSISTSHYLSASGGSEKSTYYISGGYNKNNGLVLRTDYDAYSFNAKINSRPNKKISFNVISDFSFQKTTSPSNNVNLFNYAYFANPYEKPYNADGSYAPDHTYFLLGKANGSYTTEPQNGFNVFREINETTAKTTSANMKLTGNISWFLSDELKLSGLASFSYVSDNSENINGINTYAAYQDRPFERSPISSKRRYGSIAQQATYNKNYLLRGQVNYTKRFLDIHRVNILGGSEIRQSFAKSIFNKRYGYDPVSGNSSTPILQPKNNGVFDANEMIRYARIIDSLQGQNINENAFASFYAALDYILKNKYVANFSLRTDGSNNFGSKEQFNATWSAGFSWNIDEEDFMKKTSHIISSMTLRLATGYTGGVNKSVYPLFIMDYERAFRSMQDDFYRMGYILNAPNPHLRWEKTHDMKAALDMSFFDNRLRFLTEIYHRKGLDLVTPVIVPVTTGFSTQSYNTSEQINQGVEFSLSATVLRTNDIKANISINAAYNKNELTKYRSPSGSVFGDHYVGYPLGKIFTGKVTGINPESGIYNYQLRPDAQISDVSDYRIIRNYLYYAGTTAAPWNGGFSTSVSYKGLTLSIGGVFSINGKISNQITPPGSYQSVSTQASGDKEPIPSSKNDVYVGHYNTVKEAANRWTANNPITNGYPRLIDRYGKRLYLDRDQPTSNIITKAIFLENASYLKISSLTLLYNLPEKWAHKFGLRNIGTTFTMNNLFTFTNYTGLDPEIPGIVYPQSRAFSLGINFGL